MKCDGIHAEIRFHISAKWTSPFKSARVVGRAGGGLWSGQSTAGSRGVHISGSNGGYTMFRGSVKGTGYPLHSPVSPFTSPPVGHRVPSHFNCSLLLQHMYRQFYSAIVRQKHQYVFAKYAMEKGDDVWLKSPKFPRRGRLTRSRLIRINPSTSRCC